MADRVFPTAESTSFQVDFIINEKGKVEHVNAKANHKAIAIEAIRLIKRMPRLKQPGTENGEAVKTPISILDYLFLINKYEAARVIKKNSKITSPVYLRGKPVIVPYALPVVF